VEHLKSFYLDWLLPYLKTLYYLGKACKGKLISRARARANVLQKFITYSHKKFYNTGPRWNNAKVSHGNSR
jgi:hypothetical protein